MLRLFTGRPLTDIGCLMTDPAFGGTRLRSDALSGIGHRPAVSGRPVSGVARIRGEAQNGNLGLRISDLWDSDPSLRSG